MRVKHVIMLLLLVLKIVSASDVGTVVNCAACQHLDGPWNSWACRVQCNVAPQGVQIMGSVDAFAVTLGERASLKQDLTEHEIILFDVVNVNIREGYNSTTGKFTVSIPGVYKAELHVFSSGSEQGKANMAVNRTNGSGEQLVCAAHATSLSHDAASCGTLLQLEVEDELYVKGHGHQPGALYGHAIPSSFFEAYLLYKDNA